ncbi:hypothetical protein [Arthrobacter sp. Hiyo1]|uniref:hypothetical protein n=1 Tax=Arthrobacter sp. Hiyo1 TaxID=1588020 RepID=UPI000750FE5C|nr:hypothetical protein [Arthrobacter sp. Hiyo1]
MISFLDGLRDLRTSISSGLIILFGIWLNIAPFMSEISSTPGFGSEFAKLLGFLGPVGSVALISFIAYIVGLLLPFGNLFIYIHDKFELRSQQKDRRKNKRIGQITEPTRERLTAFIKNEVDLALSRGVQPAEIYSAMDGLPGKSGPRLKKRKKIDRNSSVISDAILISIIRWELNDLATRLKFNQNEIFERYDRFRGEAEFRFALVLPLTFALFTIFARNARPEWIIVKGVEISWWDLSTKGTVLIIFLLFLRGLEANRQSISLLADSISLGIVESDSIKVLRDLQGSREDRWLR